MFTLAAAITLL